MRCDFQKRYEIITDYVSGDLAEHDMLSFEEHLLTCDQCLQDVRISQKAIFLIAAEGPDAFTPTTNSIRVLQFILKIFSAAWHYRPVKMAFAPILLFALLNAFMYPQYKQEIKGKKAVKAPDTLIGEIRDLGGPVRDQRTEELKQVLLHGQGLYYAGEYEKSLFILNGLDSLIRSRNELIDQEKAQLRREANFFSGMSHFMVWMDKDAGYWRWMGRRIGILKNDHQAFLLKAHDKFAQALALAQRYDLPLKEREQQYIEIARKRMDTN